jgi:glycerophosphoryl diester phosphodiesterase
MLDLRQPNGVTSVIAHRGVPGLEPENTLASFRRAVEVGADMVEPDVRRSADGALVVHHEAQPPDGRAIVDTRAGDLPAAVPNLDEALADWPHGASMASAPTSPMSRSRFWGADADVTRA